MEQIRVWISTSPAWLPAILAVLAAAVVVQLVRLWNQQGLAKSNIKPLLVVAVALAVAGALPGLFPSLAPQLGNAAWQLTAIGYVASALAVVVSLIERRKLAPGGASSGGYAGYGGSGGETIRIGSTVQEVAEPVGFDPPPWPGEGPPLNGGYQAAPQQTVIKRPSARQTQTAWLAALSGPHTGHNWNLGEETFLGQGLTDHCDIVLTDGTVSRGHHALIRLQDDGRYLLADLASTNHTFVNGEQVERHVLKGKDRIGIGTSVLVFMQADLRSAKGKPAQGSVK